MGSQTSKVIHLCVGELQSRGKHWVLDSGCPQHMTGYVKMFTSLDEDVGDYEYVTFGDNSKV